MTYSYPGVYIEEVPVAGPIQPVGTSTAAFIGVAKQGPINQPTLVTSFDQFIKLFGNAPMDGFYLWYTVRGFFENGGRLAYIVRASSGRKAGVELLDSRANGAQPTLIVEANEVGVPSPAIQVSVVHTTGSNITPFNHQAPVVKGADVGSKVLELGSDANFTAAGHAAHFRIGDQVLIADSNNSNSEVQTIERISGGLITLSAPLTGVYNGGTLRLADWSSTSPWLRLTDMTNLGPGAVISLNDGSNSEIQIIKTIQAERISPTLVTYQVILEAPLNNAYALSAVTATVQDFSLEITQGSQTETRTHLSMGRKSPGYIGTALTKEPFALVTVREPDIPSNAALPERRPAEVSQQALTNGAAANPQSLTLADYQEALDALRKIDDVNFVTIPDSQDASVQLALLTHCETLSDRFAIFDPPLGYPPQAPTVCQSTSRFYDLSVGLEPFTIRGYGCPTLMMVVW